MSTDLPTPTPADPLSAWAAHQRKPFAGALVALGLVLAFAAAFAFSRSYTGFNPPKDKPDSGQSEDAAKKTPTITNPWEYLCGGVAAGAAALTIGGVGIALLMAFPKTTDQARLSEARTALLIAGGSFGVCLMGLGLALFICRTDALSEWLVQGKSKSMTSALVPIAIGLLGAMIAFLAVTPARAEERTNPTLRRLVYGTNAGLTLLVLFGVLVAGNLLLGVKAPGKLDTTESGFYTLDPKTVNYLTSLDQPVKIYSTVGESVASDRIGADTRQLLEAVAAANPDRITLKVLSPALDFKEISILAAKFPNALIKETLGLLIVVGEDEKRYSFLQLDDMAKRSSDRDGRGVVYEGEGKTVRELLFLASNRQNTVVYVTQGSGELNLNAQFGRTRSGRGFAAMKEHLSTLNCDLRPLVIDTRNPKVPDDAQIVIVADPTNPLPPETLNAIRNFSNGPKNANPQDQPKRGKLLILAGANIAPDGKGLASPGIEPLLTELGVTLGTDQINAEQRVRGQLALGAPSIEAASGSTNPLAKEFVGRPFLLPGARTVTGAPVPGSNSRVDTIFSTRAGAVTWLDTGSQREVVLNWQMMLDNPALRQAKQYGTDPRSVAVAISEGETVRAIVFGGGTVFSDEFLNVMLQARSGGTESLELMAGMIDQLRERPDVSSLATKSYGMYIAPNTTFTRVFVLPVGLLMLAILALGIGVWAVRRK